jgi:iron complex outermembrane recepter protein
MLGTISRKRIAVYVALAPISCLSIIGPVRAQSQNPSNPSQNNSTLPPVVVQSPQQRQAKPAQANTQQASRSRSIPRRNRVSRNTVPPSPSSSSSAPRTETAYSHVDGYVATRSATGTKTDTPLLETPSSISVVTRDQIEAQNAQSAKQALAYTAGLAGESRSNFGGYDIMYSRGFIVDQYLDGMKLPGAAAQFPPQPELYGIERVELLRGPASMLFGQGSPGGLVNLVSKRPTDTPFNEMFIQGGSYDRIQGGFDSSGRVDKDGELLYRITGFAKDSDNQVNYVKEQRYYIAPSLTWRPTTDTTWTILASYQKDPDVGLYNFVPAKGSLLPNPLGKIPTSFYAGEPGFNQNERETSSVTSLFEHRFSDVFTIRQNTRYLNTTGNLEQVAPLLLFPDSDTLARLAQGTRENLSALTTDTQGEFKFWTGSFDHKVLVGVDTQTLLYKQRFAQSSPLAGSPLSAPPISVFNPIYGASILNPIDDPTSLINTQTHQTSQQTGVYAQDQMKIGRLSVVGGIRYDSVQTNTDSSDFSAGTYSPLRQNNSATTGRIGAIYELDSGFAPYVNYATSFNPNVATSATQPLVPTTGESFEGGIKFQPKGSRIFAQLSVFDLTQQNVVTIDPISNLASQIGEVHSRGVEVEVKASVTDRLTLLASYAHIDPKVTKSLDVDIGKRPTWVPNDIAGGWADYTWHDGALNGFGAAFGMRYTGQTWGDKANTALDIPSYTLFDAALHYDLENFDPRLKGARLSVNATNLFDKTYVSQCTSQAFDDACIYGLRRQVVATLRYRW